MQFHVLSGNSERTNGLSGTALAARELLLVLLVPPSSLESLRSSLESLEEEEEDEEEEDDSSDTLRMLSVKQYGMTGRRSANTTSGSRL